MISRVIREDSVIKLGESGRVIEPDILLEEMKPFGVPCFLGRGTWFDTELKWYPRDTEMLYDENMKDDRKRKLLEKNGWNKDSITYKLNKQGFRHDGSVNNFHTVKPGGIAYVGDSNIFGIGNRLEDTFTHLAHPKHLPYINLGCPGAGIDSYYRVVKKWVPVIKPTLLLVFHTWVQTRTEFGDSNGSRFVVTRNFEDDKFHNFDPMDVHIRWHKNIDAIKWICAKAGTKVWVMEEPPNDELYPEFFERYPDMKKDVYSRDLVHAGPEWHKDISKPLEEIIHGNL